ncbi:MAG: hypothetical protein LUF35_02750, partial [Lachnospiraceae bacterium]|nr:hypothetical protein [Lachnospiraceae bacterium]
LITIFSEMNKHNLIIHNYHLKAIFYFRNINLEILSRIIHHELHYSSPNFSELFTVMIRSNISGWTARGIKPLIVLKKYVCLSTTENGENCVVLTEILDIFMADVRAFEASSSPIMYWASVLSSSLDVPKSFSNFSRFPIF